MPSQRNLWGRVSLSSVLFLITHSWCPLQEIKQPKQYTSHQSIYILLGYFLSSISTWKEYGRGKDLAFICAFTVHSCSAFWPVPELAGDAEKARTLPTKEEVGCRKWQPSLERCEGIAQAVQAHRPGGGVFALWHNGNFVKKGPSRIPSHAFHGTYTWMPGTPKQSVAESNGLSSSWRSSTPTLLMLRLGDWYQPNKIIWKDAGLVAYWGWWRCHSQCPVGEPHPECGCYGRRRRISSCQHTVTQEHYEGCSLPSW